MGEGLVFKEVDLIVGYLSKEGGFSRNFWVLVERLVLVVCVEGMGDLFCVVGIVEVADPVLVEGRRLFVFLGLHRGGFEGSKGGHTATEGEG